MEEDLREQQAVAEAGEGEAAAPAAAADAAARLAEAEARAEDYLAQCQRLKADFDNYRRRMAQDQGRWQQQAVGSFLEQLLPVLDNLERAVLSARGGATEGAGPAGGPFASFLQGVELTLRQFHGVLAQAGVEEITALGQSFDPLRHEAVMRVEGGAQEVDTVVEVFQKGYIYKGQVVRPAMARVAVGRQAAAGVGEGE